MLTPQFFKNINTYSCLTHPKHVFFGFQDFKHLISLSISLSLALYIYVYIFPFDFRPTVLK